MSSTDRAPLIGYVDDRLQRYGLERYCAHRFFWICKAQVSDPFGRTENIWDVGCFKRAKKGHANARQGGTYLRQERASRVWQRIPNSVPLWWLRCATASEETD